MKRTDPNDLGSVIRNIAREEIQKEHTAHASPLGKFGNKLQELEERIVALEKKVAILEAKKPT